jgi:hypothetical protein
MSITPSPAPISQQGLVDQDTESVEILVDAKSPKGFETWSRTRSTGDRKSRCQVVVLDSDDSELDVSEYMFVGGVIVSKAGSNAR